MTDQRKIFELRTYVPLPGKRDDLLRRLRDTSSGFFAKHGMTNVAYWIETDENGDFGQTIYYVLGHDNLDAAKASWAAFLGDPEWHEFKATAENLNASTSKVFLTATEFSALQ